MPSVIDVLVRDGAGQGGDLILTHVAEELEAACVKELEEADLLLFKRQSNKEPHICAFLHFFPIQIRNYIVLPSHKN